MLTFEEADERTLTAAVRLGSEQEVRDAAAALAGKIREANPSAGQYNLFLMELVTHLMKMTRRSGVGRFGWPYNRLYDLFYRAGVPLDSQRVASPFISPAISSLHLYKAIDPDTWGRMIGRVNGADFAALYGRTAAVGWQSIRLPKGMTWERYMRFLLATLPERTRRNYLEKLSVSIRFWRDKGGCLSDETIGKLRQAGIRIEVGDRSSYRTDKRPVRMDYLDDIDLPEFSRLPTFKRICICILKNDHACKYMGFSPNKSERQRRKKIMEKYESLLRIPD